LKKSVVILEGNKNVLVYFARTLIAKFPVLIMFSLKQQTYFWMNK